MTLLAGLDHDPLPPFSRIAIPPAFTIAGDQWQKGLHTKFGGLLHQQIHFLALEQTLGQGEWNQALRLLSAGVDNISNDQVFVSGREHSGQHHTLAVEKLDFLAGSQAENRGHVPGFLATDFNTIGLQGLGGEVKASHTGSLS
jgi:hypothetical protein